MKKSRALHFNQRLGLMICVSIQKAHDSFYYGASSDMKNKIVHTRSTVHRSKFTDFHHFEFKNLRPSAVTHEASADEMFS